MIKLGTMPKARDAGGAKIWLRSELEDSLSGLRIAQPSDAGGGGDSTDKVFGIEKDT
jgi:hypothetical protein